MVLEVKPYGHWAKKEIHIYPPIERQLQLTYSRISYCSLEPHQIYNRGIWFSTVMLTHGKISSQTTRTNISGDLWLFCMWNLVFSSYKDWSYLSYNTNIHRGLTEQSCSDCILLQREIKENIRKEKEKMFSATIL